jgi:hypothetical protein
LNKVSLRKAVIFFSWFTLVLRYDGSKRSFLKGWYRFISECFKLVHSLSDSNLMSRPWKVHLSFSNFINFDFFWWSTTDYYDLATCIVIMESGISISVALHCRTLPFWWNLITFKLIFDLFFLSLDSSIHCMIRLR